MDQFLQGYSNFSVDFLQRALGSTDASIVVSPFNVFTTFMVLYLGARGQTAEEFRTAFRLPGRIDAQQVATYMQSFDRIVPMDFIDENMIYVRRGLTPKYSFGFDVVDFTKGTEAMVRINDAVERATNGKIRQIVNKIDADAQMLVISAIYFKGLWDDHFDKDATHPRPFWITNDRSIDVETMWNDDAELFYAKLDSIGVQLAELPYKNSNVSMLIVLPDRRDGLSQIIQWLPSIQQNLLYTPMTKRSIDLRLPKFKFESSFKMIEILRGMGLVRPFTDTAEFDLTQEQVPLKISEAIHKTTIDVNEVGTEASAATVGKLTYLSLKNWPKFYADHPFLFYILERTYRVPVFVGAVRKF